MIAVCAYVSIDFFQFVDLVFLNSTIKNAYSSEWWPLGNEEAFVPIDQRWTLVPDQATLRAKGRPISTRIRNEMDCVENSQRQHRCGLCGRQGHNRRHCPSTAQQPHS